MADRESDGDPPVDASTDPDDGRYGHRSVTAERGSGAWVRRRYRFGIVALGGLGVVFAIAGIAFPGARTLLFALSGTGLFGAVLLYVLVPERFVTATLARRTYAPLAEIGPLLVDTAGLPDRRVYVPDGDDVRLVVPDDSEDGIRMTDGRAGGSVAGLSLPTTGNGLLAEFRERGHGPLATDAEELLVQLLDALVEEFELVDHANGRAFPATKRATVVVEGSQYGPPTTFDHPVAAFLAAGLAAGLETPVALDRPERERNDRYVLKCRWQEPIAAEEWDRPSTTDWKFPTSPSTETEEPTQR